MKLEVSSVAQFLFLSMKKLRFILLACWVLNFSSLRNLLSNEQAFHFSVLGDSEMV